MPVYEYACPKCNTKFELLRPASRADDPAICEKCHATGRRLLSTFAAIGKSAYGDSMPIGGGGSSCGGCSSTNCSTCG